MDSQLPFFTAAELATFSKSQLKSIPKTDNIGYNNLVKATLADKETAEEAAAAEIAQLRAENARLLAEKQAIDEALAAIPKTDVEHVITQEDLNLNPQLTQEGVVVGEVVTLPVIDTQAAELPKPVAKKAK